MFCLSPFPGTGWYRCRNCHPARCHAWDRPSHLVPNCECNKISSLRVFFPFTFRCPAHSPAQTPARIARCAASASRQPKIRHQSSTAGHGSRRFREWPKIPQHGSCIPRFASRPHGSRPSSRKPRERNRKHRPAAGRNYHDNQCKLFLKGQYQGP